MVKAQKIIYKAVNALDWYRGGATIVSPLSLCSVYCRSIWNLSLVLSHSS